jgi:hypothetical protein
MTYGATPIGGVPSHGLRFREWRRPPSRLLLRRLREAQLRLASVSYTDLRLRTRSEVEASFRLTINMPGAFAPD